MIDSNNSSGTFCRPMALSITRKPMLKAESLRPLESVTYHSLIILWTRQSLTSRLPRSHRIIHFRRQRRWRRKPTNHSRRLCARLISRLRNLSLLLLTSVTPPNLYIPRTLSPLAKAQPQIAPPLMRRRNDIIR